MILGTNPEKILSTAHIGETGVDEQFSIIMSYPSGKTATLNGSFRVGLTDEAYIHGTEGSIRIPAFFRATSATLYKEGVEAETFHDDRKSAGYAFEIKEVGRCLNQGLLESPVVPLDESLKIMKLMDEIRAVLFSIGKIGMSFSHSLVLCRFYILLKSLCFGIRKYWFRTTREGA